MTPSGASASPGAQEIGFDSLVQEIAFESFGVRIGVRANDARVWERVSELIPPHWRPCDAAAIEQRFSVTSNDGARFTVRYDIRDGVPARLVETASWVAVDVDLPLALGLLETHLHSTVAFRAPDRIFIHGGAVAYLDRMLVLPAAALTGKSTLVTALVSAGATYYSDQFAVFDERGWVHPYLTPLRLTGAHRAAANHNGDQSLIVGEQPLPVGAIVLTSFRPGADWRPKRLSPGESVLELMSQTVPAQDRPEESMRVIRRIVDADPLVVASDRDEADAMASSLLAELERQFSASG